MMVQAVAIVVQRVGCAREAIDPYLPALQAAIMPGYGSTCGCDCVILVARRAGRQS